MLGWLLCDTLPRTLLAQIRASALDRYRHSASKSTVTLVRRFADSLSQ
jgi:hypothetical protein